MPFALNQGSTSELSYAELVIPGCGTMSSQGEDAIVYVEKHSDGRITLYVWADINQEDPTHIINLTDALLTNREKTGEAAGRG